MHQRNNCRPFLTRDRLEKFIYYDYDRDVLVEFESHLHRLAQEHLADGCEIGLLYLGEL